MKLYLNDVGILSGIFYRNNIKAVMSDIKSINLGSIYETIVAQELKSHRYVVGLNCLFLRKIILVKDKHAEIIVPDVDLSLLN